MSDWRNKARERVKEKQQGSTIKVLEGSNCLRVLPDKKDLTEDGKVNPKGIVNPPMREFRIHRNVGPDNAMVACGKNIEGKGKCWLCDKKIVELEASGSSSKRAQANEIRAAEQFVVNASRFDPDTSKFSSAKPWWVSTGSGIPGRQGQSLAVRIYSKIASGRKDYVHPIKGYNINIERTGQMLQTRYTEVEGDETPSKVPASVLATVKDLDSIIPVYSEEDQKSAYYGKAKDDDRGSGRGRGAGGGGKKTRRDAEDEEPEESEEESEESEEVEEEVEEDSEEEAEEEESEEEAEEEESEEEAEEEEEEAEEEPEEEEEEEEEAEEAEEEPEEEEAPKKAPAKKKTPAKKAAAPVKKSAPAKKAAPKKKK